MPYGIDAVTPCRTALTDAVAVGVTALKPVMPLALRHPKRCRGVKLNGILLTTASAQQEEAGGGRRQGKSVWRL